jgi:hypothetical protein
MRNGILYRYNKLCLFALTALVCLIAFFSVRSTLAFVVEYFRLNGQLSDLRRDASQPASFLDVKSFENVDINKSTFESVGKAAAKNDVVIERLEPSIITHQKDVLLFTKRMVLQGSYAGILKCLSDVAGELKNIKIASIKFIKEERGKNAVLVAEVFFQTVKPE